MNRTLAFFRLNMFQRLRLQFIAIATAAVCVILGTVFGITTLVVDNQSNTQINNILTVLSNNGGEFPKLSEISQALGEPVTEDTLSRYSYFSATLSRDNEIKSLNTDHIRALSEDEVESYSNDIFDIGDSTGRLRISGVPYAYKVTKQKNNTYLLVVLDVSVFTSTSYRLLNIAVWLSIVCLGFFVVVIVVFSGRAIRPFVNNYKKQRRFITNAGHELKTPLAIISANTELEELMNGESEWTKSTKDQIARLTGLINSLVTQARLEEQPELVLKDLDFSAITEDAAEDFKGPVIRDGKSFEMSIQPNIHVKAEEKSLFELVTLLVDNANKYCDPEGTVSVTLTKPKRSRRARLVVSNTYVAGRDVDYSRFFERFYRADESHHSETSGYGIGLSIAESMVHLFKGSIKVTYKDDTIHFIVFL